MIPCIACTRNVVVEDEEGSQAIPAGAASKDAAAAAAAAKSFTAQLKDVVLKISAGYKQCRPCASFRNSHHSVGEEIFAVGTPDASSSDEWIQHHSKSSKKQHQQQQNELSKQSSSVTSASSQSECKGQDDACSSKVSPSCSSRNSNGTACTPPKAEGGGNGTAAAAAAAATASQDDTGQEWVAQVEPGVLITFIALSHGENELKRIRFSRELFNKWQAEAWWSENCERVHELYNVSGSDRSFPNTKKEQEEQEQLNTDGVSRSSQLQAASSSDEVTEWVEEDEPGVYITVKVGPNGRELKRVRFSREKYSEKQAKLWWERNRFRVHDQYL